MCDLETAPVADVTAHLHGADAAVFAAGVRRLVVVSAMGTDREPPQGTDPVFAAYLRAKGAAAADIRARVGLDWTILRPGRLTDDPGTGTGMVTLAGVYRAR